MADAAVQPGCGLRCAEVRHADRSAPSRGPRQPRCRQMRRLHFAAAPPAPIIVIMCDRLLLRRIRRLAGPALLALALSFAMGTAVLAATAYGKPWRSDQESVRAQADTGVGDTSAVPGAALADRVVVRKSERRLYLMHGSSVL